jgi:hypothetical protein
VWEKLFYDILLSLLEKLEKLFMHNLFYIEREKKLIDKVCSCAVQREALHSLPQ